MSTDQRWQWTWSVTLGRAAIVTVKGYTVCPPQLSQRAAAGVVAEHNRIVDQLANGRNQEHDL